LFARVKHRETGKLAAESDFVHPHGPMALIREQAYDSPVVGVRTSLTESHRATPDVIPVLRHAVAEYAHSVGIDGDQLDGVRLAVSEALSNVVLHAYRENDPGYIHLTARVVGDELWVLVADDGRGHNAAPVHPGLGWGLAFITDAADEFALAERAEGGSEARMVFRLPAGCAADH
jgi:anti-sigma regulatory factor (Ser/Thr protein kinase)